MKASATRDITVGGPGLAAQAIAAGLVDEIHLFVTPIVVGGGKPALPHHVRVGLELRDVHAFDSGVAYLRYRTRYSARREVRVVDQAEDRALGRSDRRGHDALADRRCGNVHGGTRGDRGRDCRGNVVDAQ